MPVHNNSVITFFSERVWVLSKFVEKDKITTKYIILHPDTTDNTSAKKSLLFGTSWTTESS